MQRLTWLLTSTGIRPLLFNLTLYSCGRTLTKPRFGFARPQTLHSLKSAIN
ncbi:hypothetical protein CGRA01v4_05190 [Colletotrichum graminicola]|nr:hypothetical protein CGRA01v4_05190 [Colletotrichum graminicola]